MEKKPGSVFVFRNDRAEEREAARYNTTKEKNFELLFSKVQVQIEKEEEGMMLLKSHFLYCRLFMPWRLTGV